MNLKFIIDNKPPVVESPKLSALQRAIEKLPNLLELSVEALNKKLELRRALLVEWNLHRLGLSRDDVHHYLTLVDLRASDGARLVRVVYCCDHEACGRFEQSQGEAPGGICERCGGPLVGHERIVTKSMLESSPAFSSVRKGVMIGVATRDGRRLMFERPVPEKTTFSLPKVHLFQ